MKCLLLFSAVKRCNWHVLKKVWSNVLCLCWYLVHVLAVYTVLCQTHAVMWHRHLEASDVTFDFIVLATLNKIVEFAAKWKNSRYQHLPAVCRVSEADTVTNICLLYAGYLKLTLLQTSACCVPGIWSWHCYKHLDTKTSQPQADTYPAFHFLAIQPLSVVWQRGSPQTFTCCIVS